MADLQKEKAIESASFDFGKGIIHLQNFKQFMEGIALAETTHGTAKVMLKDWIRKADSILNEFRKCVPKDYAHILDEQLISDEISGQIDHINSMCVDLPKKIVDEIEMYVTARYHIYKRSTSQWIETNMKKTSQGGKKNT